MVVLMAVLYDKLGLKNRKILLPKEDMLRKAGSFVPAAHREQLADALLRRRYRQYR